MAEGEDNMQVTVGQLVAAEGALKRLQQERLPARVAFRLARILREVSPVLQAYNDAHNALVRRLWVPTEKENIYKPPQGEAWEEYVTERTSLWEDVVCINASSLKEVELATVTMSATEVLALEWMIEADDTRDEPTPTT